MPGASVERVAAGRTDHFVAKDKTSRKAVLELQMLRTL